MGVKEEIKSTIEHFFQAMDTQDPDLMKRLIPKSESTVHVCTDDGEIWKGWNTLTEATRKQFKNLEYYKASIKNLTINVADSQDVAWYFRLLDAEIKSNGKITTWEGARFTGVLKKENGQWVMAQTHVSIPESK